jgi:orotidine-5'-phosphate decarboxylase
MRRGLELIESSEIKIFEETKRTKCVLLDLKIWL